MSYLILEDFKRGLDARRSRLAAPAGTMQEALECYVTPGGELEKRKAFVPVANPNGAQAATLPAGTFGALEVAGGIAVFGSADLAATFASQGLTAAGYLYVRCQHPISYPMTAVVAQTVFGGKSFIAAKFVGGEVFCFYDGVLVSDFTAGLVLANMAGLNHIQAAAFAVQINESDSYSAVQRSVTTAQRSRTSNVATIKAVAHGMTVGSKFIISGLGGTGYNTVTPLDTVTGVPDADHFTYANTGSNEGVTADPGGTVATGIIDVSGPAGQDFTAAVDYTSVAGTISTPSETVTPVTPVVGTSATAVFKIVAGSQAAGAATAATGKITKTATAPLAGDYVVLGLKRYTFRAAAALEGEVTIGASATTALTNLGSAINHTGIPGTDYVCAAPHPWVTAGAVNLNDLPLTALKGSSGNSVAITYSAGLSGTRLWTKTAFSGGAGNCVASIKVVSPAGVMTELLGAAVDFTTNTKTTAGLVKDAINAYTGTSGYTATVTDDKVTILSSAAASPMPNNYNLQVGCGGNVCIGSGMFYLTQQASSFQINAIYADGLSLMSGTLVYPTAGTMDTFIELYATIATNINAQSGATGIVAYAGDNYVVLSKLVTRSDDAAVSMDVTFNAANTAAVAFGVPPAAPTPLTVAVQNQVFEPVTMTPYFFDHSYGTLPANALILGTTVVSATVTGGSGITASVLWRAASVGVSDRGAIDDAEGVAVTFIVSPAPSNQVATIFRVSLNNAAVRPIGLVSLTGRFVCEVTDNFGNKSVSSPVTVTFLLSSQ